MPRSNRLVTQRVCDVIERYLRGELSDIFQTEIGNTSVAYGGNNLIVTLFGKPICLLQEEVLSFYGGGTYESCGNPTRTTRERINGILALLGDHEVIEDGVRVFVDRETGECRLGKGDRYQVFTVDDSLVAIEANTQELSFL